MSGLFLDIHIDTFKQTVTETSISTKSDIFFILAME